MLPRCTRPRCAAWSCHSAGSPQTPSVEQAERECGRHMQQLQGCRYSPADAPTAVVSALTHLRLTLTQLRLTLAQLRLTLRFRRRQQLYYSILPSHVVCSILICLLYYALCVAAASSVDVSPRSSWSMGESMLPQRWIPTNQPANNPIMSQVL